MLKSMESRKSIGKILTALCNKEFVVVKSFFNRSDYFFLTTSFFLDIGFDVEKVSFDIKEHKFSDYTIRSLERLKKNVDCLHVKVFGL